MKIHSNENAPDMKLIDNKNIILLASNNDGIEKTNEHIKPNDKTVVMDCKMKKP